MTDTGDIPSRPISFDFHVRPCTKDILCCAMADRLNKVGYVVRGGSISRRSGEVDRGTA